MVAEFFPVQDVDLDIGGPNGLLFVGNSFDRDYEFVTKQGTPCDLVPTDWTGFNVIAEVLDASSVVLQAMTVVPSVGDATGKFKVTLLPAEVNTALRTSATNWQLRITDGVGDVNQPLIFANFTVT